MKKLQIIVILLVLITPQIFSQTFHAIIFADSDDEKIGESVYQDYNHMQTEFALIAQVNGFQLKEYYFIDEECNKENALKVLKRLQCEPKDVVFFYYSGHGGRSMEDQSIFPQMALGNSDAELVPMYKIKSLIDGKRPKFYVVMGDCCNSYVPGITSKLVVSKGKTVVKNNATNVYQKLFGKSKGSIVIASSSPGEASTALSDGGAFTKVFLHEIKNTIEGKGDVEWVKLIENTKKNTKRLYDYTPVYDIALDQNNNSNSNNINTPTNNINQMLDTNNEFIATLVKMAANNPNKEDRINLIQPTLLKYFDSPNAVVEIYGRNGTTLLTRENANDFLARVSTSYKLINFVEIKSEKNQNGKYTFVKLHEIYKQ